jgi:hypothetical protein
LQTTPGFTHPLATDPVYDPPAAMKTSPLVILIFHLTSPCQEIKAYKNYDPNAPPVVGSF